jgi:two-component system, LuxR family, sensor kinase FixL
VTVHVALDANLPTVMVDLLQIEQVVLNLLRNAAEAMHGAGLSHGVATIKASAVDASHVAIEIRDSGPGFPPEFAGGDLPVLSSSKTEGLGVGLSLCRSIIEAHGGRLETGGGPDGATVRFTLPIARTAEA